MVLFESLLFQVYQIKLRGGESMLKVSWEAPRDPKLQQYLKPTEFCESNHLEVQKVTAEVIKGVKTPKEAAIKIYLFIRDEIKLHFEEPKPSIEVLRSEIGVCWNKSNLQVAMLRAAKIPARYRFETWLPQLIFVFIPEAFWETVYEGYEMVSEEPVSDLVPTQFTHGLAEVYLGDKWIGCDAWLDKPLQPSAFMFDWDGEHDLTGILPWRKAITGSTSSCPVKEMNEALNLVPQDMRNAYFGTMNESMNSIRAMPDDKKYRLYLEVYGKAIVKKYEIEAQKWKK
jgi:hypothetical protein